ncbi:ABC transporter permease [Coprothermobacteraceae bacterium]|nr:ABC transporter permease [Coprothermobacteraceae bacterium]
MSWRVIKSLVKKDVIQFFSNKFYAVITVLGLVFYIAIYFALPKTIDDKLSIGFYTKLSMARALAVINAQEVNVIRANSVDELMRMVKEEKIVAGFVFPDVIPVSSQGAPTVTVKVYVPADMEQEMRDAMAYVAKELLNAEAGYFLNIESENEVVGVDLAGKQIPPSKRMIPVFIFLILMAETLGLANLIAQEIEQKTIHALLVTPATVADILTAKGITGMLTSFVPALLLTWATIGFGHFVPIIVLLLAGTLFTIAVAFLVGSLGKDLMSTLMWGALVMIILLLPTANVLAPGTLTSWVKAIPTYYFVDPLHRVISFNAGLEGIWKGIAVLLGSALLLFILSNAALRRRFQ